jgi:uncharacterized Zn-binding protein involved in type VI secretion
MVTGTVPHVGGPVLSVSQATVLIGGRPAARVGDTLTCVGPPDTIMEGEPTVWISGRPASRIGDSTLHNGKIVVGEFTVFIGGNNTVNLAGGGKSGGNGAKAASDAPQSLAECAQRLKEAAQRLKTEGYKAKFTDGQLCEMAAQPESNSRFLVSLQEKPKKETKSMGLDLGTDTPKTRFFSTSFEQMENADHDARLLSAIQGMTPPDPKKEYVLYILDRGADFENDGIYAFSPTWDNMQEVSVREFSCKYKPGVLGQVMTPEYQEIYHDAMMEFHRQNPYSGKGKRPEFIPEKINSFAKQHFATKEEQELFKTRHKAQRMGLGANKDFLGTGVTKNLDSYDAAGNLKDESLPKYGTAELLVIENNPKNIAELQASGRLLVVPCNLL